MDIRLSLSLHYIALETSVWPAWPSVFPHCPTGKMLPQGPWPPATPLWPAVPSHLTNCKGLDSTWMRSGVSLDWIQAWFNKVLHNLFIQFPLLLFLYLSGLCILSSPFSPQVQMSFCFPKFFSPLLEPQIFLPLSFSVSPLTALHFFKTNMNWLQEK